MSNPFAIPVRIGLGTSGMGEAADRKGQELDAIRYALDIGYRLFDTAEIYGKGEAEKLLGQALRGFGENRRSEVYIASKVYPDNASRAGTIQACESSLERLGCGYIDLYQLHWRGPHPFKDTLQAFDELRKRKLVRNFGVSNFDVDDLREWRRAEKQLGISPGAISNQGSYRADRRGWEYGQMDWMRQNGFQMIGYGPLGQGELTQHPVLREVAEKRGATAAQIALAFCFRIPDLISIPKSIKPERINENYEALNLTLTADELRQLEQAFPLKNAWLKSNPLLRHARSTARRLMRLVKPPASRTVPAGHEH
jgi:diketogulonate reductase-like aldo/keto reductase